MADTSLLDSLAPVPPTEGMMAAGMSQAAKAAPDQIPTVTIHRSQPSGGTSLLDSLAPVSPTDSMLMAVGKKPGTAPEGQGIASNFAAGANKQIFGALGAPVDLATGAMNLIPRGINAAAGTNIPTIDNPVGGSQWLGQQFGKVSVDPNTIQPSNEAERIAQGAGGGVAAVPTLALSGAAAALRGGTKLFGSVANAIRSSGGSSGPSAALTTTAAGVGGGAGQAASDAVPEWAKPYADLAGNIAGAGAVAGGVAGVRNGLNLITRKAGEAGIGSKLDLNGVRATASQANAAGDKLASAIGPEGQQNIARSLDTEAQARAIEANPDAAFHQAEQERLTAKMRTFEESGAPFWSSLPSDVQKADADWQTRNRAMLPSPGTGPGIPGPGVVPKDIQERRVNLVPDANPTTAQLAQTPGATDLENALRVQNGPAFSERAQQQNNARVASVQALEPNQGEPGSVGQFFTKQLQKIDAAGQQTTADHAGKVQGLTDTVGGQAPTAQYGGQLREALVGAEAPEHAAASAAFRAVDPDGAWALPSSPLKDVGKRLAADVSQTAQTDSQTNALLARAQSLPDVIKFSDLSQMRADANDALKRLMRTGTAPSEVRRLTILKGGIDDAIAQSINERAASDPAIQDRIHAAVGESNVQSVRGDIFDSAGASSNQGNDGGSQGRRGSANAGSNLAGADLQGDGGKQATAGTPGLTPNVGADEAGRYYHGTRHEFDSFDISRIGSGEGNHAYGHGFYFAENEDVAKHYRDKLAGQRPKAFNKLSPVDASNEASISQAAGHLLRVRLNASPDELLDWNKPLSAQSRHIQKALSNIVQAGDPTENGSDIYRRVSNQFGLRSGKYYSPQEASQALSEAGIKGIRYLDEGSRVGNSPETHNVVIFDPSHIEVTHRNGEPIKSQTALPPPSISSLPAGSNFGADEAGKYYSAVQGWKDLKQKFGQGGVGQVLKENDQGFKVPEGNVPGKIFTAGPTEPAEVERFITAVGGPDKALDIGRNVLANDLRNKGIARPDGTVDAAKLEKWNAAREPTLAQFPGLKERFGDIAAAQRTLDDVTASHKAAIADFNKSAAAQFIHADPAVAVRRALASENPTETFTQLAQAVRGNPAAEAGLKRAVVDYVIAQHSSAVPSADGIDMLKAAGFRGWIDKYKGPMRALFGGQGLQNLEMVAADLRRQAQGPAAVGGSQTASHQSRAARLAVGAAGHGASITALTIIGERLGEHLGEHGMIGAVAVPAIGMAVHALRQAGVKTVTDLTREAMLHPELARVLMEKANASKTISVMSQRRIAKALQDAIVADMTIKQSQ